MSDFRMPFLGADMEGGKVVEWLKKPGDKVEHGEIIAVVETEKGAIEIEVFEDGVLADIVADVGDYRDVGDLLAHIDSAGGETKPDTTRTEPAPPAAQTVPATPTPPQPQAAPAPQQKKSKRPRVSPVALKRAEELGIDLTSLTGTGHEGAITLEDVEQSVATAKAPPKAKPEIEAEGTRGIDLDRMRSAIAAAMAHSKREVPHYYVSATIDVTKAMDWLTDYNNTVGVTERALPAVLLIKATALALREVPSLNGTWGDSEFKKADAINVGIAISLRGGGLAAPAILETDHHSISELMEKLRDLTGRVRLGNMRGSEIGGGTFTVSSVGEGNIENVIPIIYPPQVGILGLGSIMERPWIVDGKVCSRQVVTATLAGDHRVTDGRIGARFLEKLDRLLQEPETL
ncbi:MAG: dihydrolipoamide acetyltransferase family protein [Parvibaculaceae bacterium]